MLLNYIKIAYRNLIRYKGYTVINIAGLSVGMACAILLLLFVQDELSFDRHNSKYNQIYMVHSQLRIIDNDAYYSGSPLPIGAALKDEYPAVEESVRLFKGDKFYFADQNQEIIGEDHVFYADPGVFRVFDHHFVYGSPEDALDAPGAIVINESLAKKYFGDQNPVGKMLKRNNGAAYLVQGVFRDIPRSSSQRYDALLCIYDLQEDLKHTKEQGGIDNIDARRAQDFFSIDSRLSTYILLAENADITSIEKDIERFKEKYFLEFAVQQDLDLDPIFLPLSDVHLRSGDLNPGTIPFNLLRLYILSFLSFLILFSACINYVNIATAKSSGRAREVGVRKALGADRVAIIAQFLGEAILVATAALFIALGLIELLLPSFNDLADKTFGFSVFLKPHLITGVMAVGLIVGCASGSYPAFLLSSGPPANLMQANPSPQKARGYLRKTLVIVQFSISVAVIIMTLLHREQVGHIKNLDLGFDHNDIMVISPKDPKGIESLDTLQKKLLGSSMISAAARSNTTAGKMQYHTNCEIEDMEGRLVHKSVCYLFADSDFINLMEMEILEGQNFSHEMGPDQSRAFLVSETLVKEMGWSDAPIGKRIQYVMDPDSIIDGHVIGVVKDMLFSSWREAQPMLIIPSRNEAIGETHLPILSIRIPSGDSASAIEFIEDQWRELNPQSPFDFNFLANLIGEQFEKYDNLNRIFIYFSILSILISCIGLFGLSSFVAESRTKEIGIRKVVGASTWNILLHLSLDFIRLFFISILIAAPIAYYGIAKWQELLPHKAGLNPSALVVAASIALAIAILTVGYHAIKASLTDPVKAFRYE